MSEEKPAAQPILDSTSQLRYNTYLLLRGEYIYINIEEIKRQLRYIRYN